MKSSTKKGFLSLLLVSLLMIGLSAPVAFAGDETEGPLVYTLPEDATIVLGKTFDSYVISWEPMEDVHQYWISAYLASTYWEVIGGGWLGTGYIADGEGETYKVDNVVFDGGMKLEGDAIECDIVDLINAFCAVDKNHFSESALCNLSIIIIPQSGEPITQLIEIPFELEG